MLTKLLTIALNTCATSALSLPPPTQPPQNPASHTPLLAIPTNASTPPPKTADCFSARRLPPASYADCVNAASALLDGIPDPHRPRSFARKGNAGFGVPRTVRRGTCVVALDVASDDERDEVQPWAACVAALGLADRCLGGGYRLGGRSTVGARGVVGLVVCGREGRDGEGLGLEMADVATVDGGGIDGSVLGTGNTTSLELRTRSRVNVPGLDARGMCVEMPGDHAIGAAVDYGDCYRAAEEIIEGKPRDIPLRFSRKPNAEYRLPATFDYGTCSIIVDVLDANDEDTFGVSTLYGAALDVANRCTMSPGQAVDIWGGNRTAGLKGLVNVFVSGMGSLDVVSGPTTSGNAQIVPRTQAESKVPESSDSSSLNSDVPILEALAGGRKPGLNTSAIISKRSSAGIGTSLRGPLTCYDPPLPRELLYPYVASDCDEASDQIVGNRNKWAAYIFSRKPSISPYWYQLPVKYKYGSCVILIDMNDDKAEDAVRVTYVASSAWVLARKCSGEENPEYRYGGFMTAIDTAEPDIDAIAKCVLDK